MINGEGLRVVLWLSGCTHNCPNCQNPQTHDPESGIVFDESAVDELYEQLNEDWCSGITFSGGDPLHPLNRPEVTKLCMDIKRDYPNKTIWLWTGYTWETLLKFKESDRYISQLLRYVDVIIDGPFIEKLKDSKLKYRGSSNQRIIDVHKSLTENKVILFD